MLRQYQRNAIDGLYNWFETHKHDYNKNNPCIVMPTGAGKSHIIAELCKEALHFYPGTKILMLTHVKELIEQNAEKLKLHWPDAPLGIYSAGLGEKNINQITFGGIQSVHPNINDFDAPDLIIIDECHLINHKNQGRYRSVINLMRFANPDLKVIGLTATPYRLGHGLITDGDAIFDDLIEPVTIEQLINEGYLAKLQSKLTKTSFDTEGIKKTGGDFNKKELDSVVNTQNNNLDVARQIIDWADNRQHWLLFCTSIEHSKNMAQALIDLGIAAGHVDGVMSSDERANTINAFKSGELKALCNCNVLTTGFDYPDIDLIALLRPTQSTGLYVQMAGRGLRLKSQTDHCLILDFAKCVQTHGPITSVIPPSKTDGKGDGKAPFKVCDFCHEIVHPKIMVCTFCGEEFKGPEPKELELDKEADILGENKNSTNIKKVKLWKWYLRKSKKGNLMIVCEYFESELDFRPVIEYFNITSQNQWARNKSFNQLRKLGADVTKSYNQIVEYMNKKNPPEFIEYKIKDGFYDVIKYGF